MIQNLLLIYLFVFVTGQSPPLQVGDSNQYVLAKLNREINLTCPFKDVEFYKWNYYKIPTQTLSEQRDLRINLTSVTKSDIYECEAVNGYGRRNGIFVVKGIDVNSKQFDIDCQSRENGPCFLASGYSNNFEFTVEENSKIAMDCRSVVNSSNKNSLTYNWKKMSPSDSYQMKLQNSQNNLDIKNLKQFIYEVPPIGKVDSDNIADMSKWGPIVMFEKVSKDMDGVYQCIVSSTGNTIRRTFKIKVKETRITSTIEGPLNQTIKADIGSTQTLRCKAYTKPKWGKKLDKTDETPESDEIIKWGGSRYKMLQGTLDIEHKANGGSLKESDHYENNLILDNIQQSQSGIYVCTVLTSSTLEHKYVNLSVEAGSVSAVRKNNNFPIYIAVPTTVFIICLATIIYCLIHRRIRQKANFKNRAARGATATTTNSSSGNGSFNGSKNTSNPRHHMLTTTTSSSKGSQNQFSPNSGFNSNMISAPGYGPNHPTFSTGYTPVALNYNFTGPSPYNQATNNNANSADIDHPCAHHNYQPSYNTNTGSGNNCHPIPYDSDNTPSPPPPTSVADALSISATINNNVTANPNILAPYSVSAGVSVNSYSPNQSSQVYMANQTPHGSSTSTSVSSPNAIDRTFQQQQQQPVYPVGVMYSA